MISLMKFVILNLLYLLGSSNLFVNSDVKGFQYILRILSEWNSKPGFLTQHWQGYNVHVVGKILTCFHVKIFWWLLTLILHIWFVLEIYLLSDFISWSRLLLRTYEIVTISTVTELLQMYLLLSAWYFIKCQ